jgi:hypothetical protein
MKNVLTLNAKLVRTLTTVGFWSNTSFVEHRAGRDHAAAAETSLGEQGGASSRSCTNARRGRATVDEAAFGGRS